MTSTLQALTSADLSCSLTLYQRLTPQPGARPPHHGLPFRNASLRAVLIVNMCADFCCSVVLITCVLSVSVGVSVCALFPNARWLLENFFSKRSQSRKRQFLSFTRTPTPTHPEVHPMCHEIACECLCVCACVFICIHCC